MAAITVIIPLYNKERQIKRAVCSVQRQTFKEWRLIVVNDGSTDNGPRIVREIEDSRIELIHQDNAGPGAARNAGLKASAGEYVVFLDADDEFTPDFLEASLANLQNNPDCDASVCAHFRGPDKIKVWTPGTAGLTISKGPWRLPLDIEPEQVKSAVDCLHSGSVLCKREIVENFSGYYEKHSTYGEDSYLWIQVLFNCSIFFDPTPRMWYHTEDSVLGMGRVGVYPVWPKVLDPYPIRQNCPQEYRDLLEKCLDFYALEAIKRCINGRDWTTPLLILKNFPTTTAFSDEFQVLRRQVKYSPKAVFSRAFRKKHIDRSRWDIRVAVTPVYSPDNPYQDQLRTNLEKQGVTVYDFKAKTILLKRIIRWYKVDILHLHWIAPFFIRETRVKSWFRGFIFLSKLCIIRLSGVKIVWTMHNLTDHEEPFPVLSGFVRRLVAKLASAIIVHSEIARKAVCEDFGKSINRKLSIVPHGHFIDCYPNKVGRQEAREKLGIADDRFVYLFFGAVRQYKGVDKLINAFNQLDNPAATLIIAGKALNEELNRKITDMCGGNENITFVSTFIKPEDIQLYMNACDIVVFPYRKILTSGAVILAMSFGRACVAPKIGCVPDVLDENGAFLYEGGVDDEQRLLEAMRCAFENRQSVEQFGLHNRKLAEKWKWSGIAEMTAKIYRRALSWG
ncbi:MAG: glycosyltransferase [Planctomycetota bacterium]|jgi:glycosyltransferase involved in cell wall biosynthesis